MNIEIIKAAVLGVVEGITEFLPISSTGHLILAGDSLGFNDDKAKTFEVFIQLGAILAVVWMYRWKLTSTLKSIGTEKTNRFLLNLLIAFLPGVSRSGATIMGAMCFGLDRKAATEFSFFLAIPTMFAAVSYDLLKTFHSLSINDLPVFAVGFIVSFFSALIVIKAFLGFVVNHTFDSFAVYRIIFGTAVLFYYIK